MKRRIFSAAAAVILMMTGTTWAIEPEVDFRTAALVAEMALAADRGAGLREDGDNPAVDAASPREQDRQRARRALVAAFLTMAAGCEGGCSALSLRGH